MNMLNMMNMMLVVLILGCGDKTELDTAFDASESSTNNDSDTSDGSNLDSGDGDTADTDDESSDNGETSGDDDGDGYTDEDDCNDTDPYSHPGAMEFPGDGVDQDCDGIDPVLKNAGSMLDNPGFELEENGVPTDWSDLGDALLWQSDGSEIETLTGGTGEFFESFQDNGSLKIWGDYGADPFGNGESIVYQQFLPTTDWNPVNKIFWIDAWAMIHDSAPLENGAEFSIGIRCLNEFFGTRTVVAESFSSPLNKDSSSNEWRRTWAQVECPADTSLVQSILLFKQVQSGQDSSDNGAVYVDEVHFGTL